MAYTGKFTELEQLYSSQDCCHIETLAGDDLLISDAELEAWVKDIYTNGKGTMHIPTVQKVAKKYWQAVQDGYGKNFNDVDLNSSDATMLTHLANNCYTFSAAKNRTHLQQLTALINDNGKIREWPAYYQEAQKLNLKLNKTWLKTEYDLAIAGGTMASKWVQFESDPNAMLRYSTVGDARVRDTHRALDGITLPVTHVFWNTRYPPNGFKCRCDVDKLPYSSPATPNDKIPGTGDDTVPPLFQVNLGKSHLAFPPKHPYYTNATTPKPAATKAGKKSTSTEVDPGGGFTPVNLDEFKAVHDSKIDTSIFSYLKKETPLVKNNRASGASYKPWANEVHIPLNERAKRSKYYIPKVIYHEYGHAIDWQYNLRGNELVKDLMEKHRKILSKDHNAGYKKLDEKLFKIGIQAYKKNWFDVGEMVGGTRDTIMSLNARFGDGHKKAYWNNPGFKEAEFIAHMFENVYCGNPVFKKYWPDLYDDMLLLWEQLKKEVIQK